MNQEEAEKYKNNPLALQAWQDGFNAGIDQCKIPIWVMGGLAMLVVSLTLVGVTL